MPVSEVYDERTLATKRILEFYKCAQERRKIGVEADDGPQEEVRLKIFHLKEEYAEHKGVLSRHVSDRRKKLGRVVQTETEECIDQTAGT